MADAYESPHTPIQDEILTIPDTEEQSHYFWHYDHRRHDETLQEVADAHGISERTGLRWRQEREQFSNGRRTRKQKAQQKGHKLGRPYRVSQEQLQSLLTGKENPVRDAPIPVQKRVNNVPLCPRALRYNLSNCEDAHLYAAAYSDEISVANKRARVRYGNNYKEEPI
ncbi:hypothetical protein CC86DRAFT_407352 [Ophiobolus disseminans]|uniref:Uncharacterized protein n=1 Tax=Ophiobolus disseminans TaxID=1469910 RepID=A0A6A6ZWM8_9PLEO|nr:hypothetical protein CC86DRAFT_407352 [Ophiobolus disseminans]